MKVCICCGGTGGHIYPGLALAEQLTDCFFIGGHRLEKDLIPQAGFKFFEISVHRKNPFKILKGFFEAIQILSKENPQAVISTGGYVTIPTILAAKLLGKKVYLQEQNILPGKVNRFLSHLANKIFVSFELTEKYFRFKNTVVTGNPIRKSIAAINYDPMAEKILIFGGSLSAKKINEAAKPLLEKPEWQEKIILLDGTNYSHIMEVLYQKAKLVVCRAGATSLAEIAAVGIPAVLIPYPHAAENHQEINARYFQDNGAAEMILDQDLNSQNLEAMLQGLLQNPDKILEMSKKMQELGSKDAAQRILKTL